MTVKELQAEAKKLGYRLTKIPQKPVPILPCPICGKKRTSIWYKYLNGAPGGIHLRCNTVNCTFEGFSGQDERGAREGWNSAAKKLMEEINNEH